MKKILTTLFVTTAICFSSILFLAGETKDPIDFLKLEKAFSSYEESRLYESEGKTVKSKKAQKEADGIFQGLFAKGKIIIATESCYFLRHDDGYNQEHRKFALSCLKPQTDYEKDNNPEKKMSLTFGIIGTNDLSFINVGKGITAESLLEKFEDTQAFKGKIQVTEHTVWGKKFTYSINSHEIEVNCKILSLTPIEIKEENDPVDDTSSDISDDKK
jgi:hypothetical protein